MRRIKGIEVEQINNKNSFVVRLMVLFILGNNPKYWIKEMFKIICRFILLAIPTVLVMGCTTSHLGIYDRNRSAYAGSIFGPSLEQQERERQKTEMQRLVVMQRQSKQGASEIPIELAQKLLTGNLKGGACNKKISVVINLAGPNSRKGDVLKVNGAARVFRQPEQSNSETVEMTLAGDFNINSGILYLQSIPTPPTREQNMEVKQRRQQAVRELETKKREFENSYGKLAALPRMTPEERGRALEESKTKKATYVAEYYRVNKMQALAQPTPPSISFTIDIGRDTDGRGWAGVIDGDGFKDCPQIALASEEGYKTSELPPITGEIAFARARPRGFAWPSRTIQIYWLNIAADQENTNAQFALGQIHEKQGKETPQDYQRALLYYRAAGDKGNAPAQSALSRMYTNGLATPPDPKESQRWAKLAEKQYDRASKVCVAQKTVKEVDQLMKDENNDPILRTTQVVALMFAQTAINFGTHQITDVTLESLSSINLPFRCTVTAKRIGARMLNFTPSFEYAGTDEYGNRLYRDQRVDQWMKENITNIANEGLKKDYKQSFDIEPLGGQRYKLTLVKTIAEMREYSKIINLD